MKLVSAIMPTAGRYEFAVQAIESFLKQTYQNKELIILDDIANPSFGSISATTIQRWPAIHYYRESVGPLGTKRNRCCELATGEIIVHFDDDDHSEPERIADQVQRLKESGKQVTGYWSMIWFDENNEPQWAYHELEPTYEALGTSLCYTKAWWQDHPFVDIPFHNLPCVGEDNEFVRMAVSKNEWISAKGAGMMVARIHPKQTSPKTISDFRPYSGTIPPGFAKLLKPV